MLLGLQHHYSNLCSLPSFLCGLCALFCLLREHSHLNVGRLNGLISTLNLNYICKDPIFKYGHILRFWVDMNFGGTLFNPLHSSALSRWQCSTSTSNALSSLISKFLFSYLTPLGVTRSLCTADSAILTF